jgi:GTP-binding protein
MFLDEVVIHVKGGHGGRGCVSFHREKFITRGGPDGGNGGKGGDVVIRVNQHLNTLSHLAHQPRYAAFDGEGGRGNKQFGKDARDLIIEVPLGTLIKDVQSEIVLKDLKNIGESIIIAAGGKGGRGNALFATSIHQTPRHAEKGIPGEERDLHLELKLIADVGLVGLPNAGKSTILSVLTSARPKIAAYPFTTKEPYLGIIEGKDYQPLVLADLPGLIKGAHAGTGLGDKFLKHIERTRLIAHVIDFSTDESPVEAYHTIREELKLFSNVLARKPEIIIANKMDMHQAQLNLKKYQKSLPKRLIAISALKRIDLKDLVHALFKHLKRG